MKLPLITESTQPIYPGDNKCPVCSVKIGEPHSFLVVNGGAMKQTEKDLFEMDFNMSGFLDIDFHGAHGKGKGLFKNKHTSKQIVTHSKRGQFDLYFCSPACFRTFINTIIDDIEADLDND